MFFFFMYHPEKDLKIIFKSPTLLLIKMKDGDGSTVVGYNFEHAKMGIGYVNTNIANSMNNINFGEYGTHVNRHQIQIAENHFAEPRELRQLQFELPTDPSDYPYYAYVGEGETETPETPTKTFLFPPPETVEQFFERIHARLLHLTRRIRALRHEEPHQKRLERGHLP